MLNRCTIRLVLQLISAALLITSAASASAQSLRDRIENEPDFQIYSVIFGITVINNSTPPAIRLAGVTDPMSGTTDDIPDEYVQAVKNRYVLAVENKTEADRYEPELKDGKPVEFFTYFFYVPGHPEIVVVDLDMPLDDQP